MVDIEKQLSDAHKRIDDLSTSLDKAYSQINSLITIFSDFISDNHDVIVSVSNESESWYKLFSEETDVYTEKLKQI